MVLVIRIYSCQKSKMTKTRSSQEKIVFGVVLAMFLHRITSTGICLIDLGVD